MNCFEWQSRASDFLDGALAPGLKNEADRHVDECRDCGERYKHYRMILSSIASQPRSALPVPIRKSPLTAHLPRSHFGALGPLGRFSRTRWQQVPWFIRVPSEATGIVLLILGGISAAPKIRGVYERSIEKRISEFSDGFTPAELAADLQSLDGGDGAAIPTSARGRLGGQVAANESTGDDFSSEGNESDDSGEDDSSPTQAGKSEVWRFNLKTDSPHEIRPKVVLALTGLKIPSSTPGIGGVEAPGGIQFDLLVPRGIVPTLKKQLQKLAPHTPEELSDSPVGETFTWFKNKSKRQIPDGKTRVVIWISQM